MVVCNHNAKFPFHLLLVVVSRFFLVVLRFSFLRSDFVQTTVIFFFLRFGFAGLSVSQPVQYLSPSLFCYKEPLFRRRTELHIFSFERSHLTGCRLLIVTVNKWVYGAVATGRTNFPIGFSQRFQRVRVKKKNKTAFSNVSNGLGEISQRLFSTPSTGKEKNPTAFQTRSTLSSTLPTGSQLL